MTPLPSCLKPDKVSRAWISAARTILASSLLLAFLSPPHLSAQTAGTPIRLQTTTRPGKWITGRSASITADSVMIIPDKTADTLRFDKRELGRLDVSQGRKSYAGRGALMGAGVGLVAGLAWYAAIDCTDSDNPFEQVCPVLGTELALITTAGGAAGGAIIGAFIHHEKWKGVKLGTRLSARLQGRRGVGVTVEF
jgi:hypothetical protein